MLVLLFIFRDCLTVFCCSFLKRSFGLYSLFFFQNIHCTCIVNKRQHNYGTEHHFYDLLLCILISSHSQCRRVLLCSYLDDTWTVFTVLKCVLCLIAVYLNIILEVLLNFTDLSIITIYKLTNDHQFMASWKLLFKFMNHRICLEYYHRLNIV